MIDVSSSVYGAGVLLGSRWPKISGSRFSGKVPRFQVSGFRFPDFWPFQNLSLRFRVSDPRNP